jgi:hypothetical protein
MYDIKSKVFLSVSGRAVSISEWSGENDDIWITRYYVGLLISGFVLCFGYLFLVCVDNERRYAENNRSRM